MKNGRVIINRKICDNAPECSGIEVCPTSAMHWDDEKQEVAFDESICMDCGMCAEACPVGAILWGEDDQDYNKKLQEVEDDPRTFEELSVERYGASPIETPLEQDEMAEAVKNCETRYLLLELFVDASINCLVQSIRIEDIKNWFDDSVSHHKVIISDPGALLDLEVNEFPTLLVFRNHQLLGMVSGYYEDDTEQLTEFKKQVASILQS